MESKIIKRFMKDHEGEEITKHEGNFSSLVWGTACLLIYSPLLKKYFKGDFGSLALLLEGKKGIGFFNFDKYKESTRQALEKYLNRKKEFIELKDFEQIQKKVNNLYKEGSPEKLKKMGDKELELFITKSFELLRDWQVITLFSEALDEEIVKEYLDKLKENIDLKEFFEMASLVDFESFIASRDKTLIKFDKKNFYNIQWVFGSYLYCPPLEECKKLYSEMIHELGGKEQLKEGSQQLEKEIKDNKQIVINYKKKLSGKLKDLFEFIKITMYIRDVRKKESYEGVAVMSNSIREMFLRLKLNQDNVIYTVYDDFKTGDYREPDFKEKLEKRKKGFIIYFGRKKSEIDYVDFNEAKQEIYREMFGVNEDINEIRGNIANKGYAKGEAKIILSASDFSKFGEKDILVTSMTRPEFVPLMKKASAVITDEGGITSHAAILSRELNKPCIIGTKNATNILKDKDLIEVDANKGIIKILEKSNEN